MWSLLKGFLSELLSEVIHQRRPCDPRGTKMDKPVSDDAVKTGSVQLRPFGSGLGLLGRMAVFLGQSVFLAT